MNTIKPLLKYIGKEKLYLLGFIFLFAGLLTLYGIKGIYSRYNQDDYCYGYRVRVEGFWNMQIQTYLNKPEFNSDRYSLTFAHSLVELAGGPRFVPILPTMEILVWVISLAYVIYRLQAWRFSREQTLVAVTSALVILFFTLYLAPNLYQILFWLSGMQTYLTPIVLGTFLLGRFIAIVRSQKFKFRHGIELSLLCLIVGGFSETTAFWQLVCWAMILAWALIFCRRSELALNARFPALVTFLSTVLALVILAGSPGNYISASFHPPSLTDLIVQPFIYGAGFIWLSLKSTPLPYVVVMAFGFLLSIVIDGNDQRRPADHITEILVMLPILYILSVVVVFPALFVTGHYPGDRALLPANFSLVLCLFLFGWKTARLISSFRPALSSYRLTKVLLILLGLALFGYIARTYPRVYDKLPAYHDRAAAWDLRQSMILKDKTEGLQNITIPAFDSVYGITELHVESENWVNGCAANYYGVSTISAVDKYDGISAYPIGK